MRNWLTMVLACGAMLGCASQQTISQTAQHGKSHAIQIDDMTLYVQSPSLLRPSRDFPPPYLEDRIKLAEVTRPKGLFGGHWDGPRYQSMSVSGTLVVNISVGPWPDVSLSQKGCRAKALAYAEKRLSLLKEDYKRGYKMVEPTLHFKSIKIGGAKGFYYTYPLSDNDEQYVIPLSDQHFIYLSIRSIDNSPLKGEWPALAERAKAELLNSLDLVGNAQRCE